VLSLEYLIEKHPVPTKLATVVIKVKSCQAFLRVLLVCVLSYRKTVVRYTFLILDIYHPDTLYLRGQGCVVRRYFSKSKGVR